MQCGDGIIIIKRKGCVMFGNQRHFFGNRSLLSRKPFSPANFQSYLCLPATSEFFYKKSLATHFISGYSPVYSLFLKLAVQVDEHESHKTEGDLQRKAYQFMMSTVAYVGSGDFVKSQVDNPKGFTEKKLAWNFFYKAVQLWSSKKAYDEIIEAINSSIHHGNILGHYFKAMVYLSVVEEEKSEELYPFVLEHLLQFLVSVPGDFVLREKLVTELKSEMHSPCDVQKFSLDPFINAAEDILKEFLVNKFNFDAIDYANKSFEFKLLFAKWGRSISVMKQLLEQVDDLIVKNQTEVALKIIQEMCLLCVPIKVGMAAKYKWQLVSDCEPQVFCRDKASILTILDSKLAGLECVTDFQVVASAILIKLHMFPNLYLDCSLILPLMHVNVTQVMNILWKNKDFYLHLNPDRFYELLILGIRYNNSAGILNNYRNIIPQDFFKSIEKAVIADSGRRDLSQIALSNLFNGEDYTIFFKQSLKYADMRDAKAKVYLNIIAIEFWSKFYECSRSQVVSSPNNKP